MIDFHAHLGRMYREDYPQRLPMSPHQMVDYMNRHGIAVSVLLPLESPEGTWGYFLTEDAIAARDLYPERFVAFCGVDPRYPRVKEFIDFHVRHSGCRGFGEHVNGLRFDDPLNKVIYAACDEHALPLVFGDDLGCYDEPGLPRLEACLKEFTNVQFCGHGPGFWSAISADDDRKTVYPKTKITPGGTLDRLLEKYDNLYCDLSAMSGYNAMSRDPDFTMGFIGRHWRKLLWGTDYLTGFQEIPQHEWLSCLPVCPEIRQAIAEGNARTLLKWPTRS